MDGGKPIARATLAGPNQGLRRTEFNFAGHELTRRFTACPAKLNSVRLSPGRLPLRCLPGTRWLVLLAILVAIPARLDAYSGAVFYWPQGAKPKHGLRLTIDARGVDANGYRPVRVEVATWPPGPALADRSIRVVLEPRNWRAQRPTIRVSGQIEIPEGATRGETILAIPQSDQWGSLTVSTYEDGQLLTDLSGSTGNFTNIEGDILSLYSISASASAVLPKAFPTRMRLYAIPPAPPMRAPDAVSSAGCWHALP